MTRISPHLLLVGVLCALGPAAHADDAASDLSRQELDRRVRGVLLQAMKTGAAIYNAGDHAGCYRLYQGTLTALAPLLDHRAALQESVQNSLKKAESQRSLSDRAVTLRAAIDDIELAVRPRSAKSLWDRLGGEKAVRAVIHDFVATAATNPKVNFDRGGKFKFDAKTVAQLEQLLVELVSAVSGGPLKYSGRDMKTTHAGMRITSAEFDALAGDLVATLKKYNVPQKELDELIGIVAATKADIVEK